MMASGKASSSNRMRRFGCLLAAAAVLLPLAPAAAQDEPNLIPANSGNVDVYCVDRADCGHNQRYLFGGLHFQLDIGTPQLAKVAQRAAQFGVSITGSNGDAWVFVKDGKQEDGMFRFLCSLPSDPNIIDDTEVILLSDNLRYKPLAEQQAGWQLENLSQIKSMGGVRCFGAR